MLNEDLLSAWLKVSCAIDNQRLAAGLPYNEAMVCHLLMGAEGRGERMTASRLCAEMHVLKSQMNAILSSMERKGILRRLRSDRDRRLLELELLPQGRACWQEGHRIHLGMADRVVAALGEEQTRALTGLLKKAADLFDKEQLEV